MRRPNHKVIVTTNKHISVNPSVVLSERERAQKQTHNKPWGETVKTPQGKQLPDSLITTLWHTFALSVNP